MLGWSSCPLLRDGQRTDQGDVFNFDALSERLALPAREQTEALLSAGELNELVKNRCQLLVDRGVELWPFDTSVDERGGDSTAQADSRRA